MRHTKMIVFGIVLAVVIVFTTIFWGDLIFNQQEIANTPVPPAPELELDNRSTKPTSSSDDLDSIEADLNGTDVENVDSDNDEIEAELNAL